MHKETLNFINRLPIGTGCDAKGFLDWFRQGLWSGFFDYKSVYQVAWALAGQVPLSSLTSNSLLKKFEDQSILIVEIGPGDAIKFCLEACKPVIEAVGKGYTELSLGCKFYSEYVRNPKVVKDRSIFEKIFVSISISQSLKEGLLESFKRSN